MKTLDDLTLRRNEKEAIREATRMLKEKFPVKEVILFDSKARGDSDADSDIDLFLVTKRSIHWKERRAIIHALFDLGMDHDVIFSILDTTELATFSQQSAGQARRGRICMCESG